MPATSTDTEPTLVATEPAEAATTPRHAWLANLTRELFQTEQSAHDHPLAEAERLGDVPPALVLRAIAAHAGLVLTELAPLMERRGLPVSMGGRAVGAAFSQIRDRFVDLLLSAETSYRGTLLGMRHGVDLVELIHYVAGAEGDTELVDWCANWLERRRPLVEAAARELAWFAAHPDRARAPTRPNPLAMIVQSLVGGIERVADKLRNPPPAT